MKEQENIYKYNWGYDKVLEGLEAYYPKWNVAQLNQGNKSDYLKPIEIKKCIELLKNIKIHDPEYSLCVSHPHYETIFEDIERIDSLSDSQVLIAVGYLYSSGIFIVTQNAKDKIRKKTSGLDTKEKLTYLVQSKYYYQQNNTSFPHEFIDKLKLFLDSEINRLKELDNISVTKKRKKVNVVSIFKWLIPTIISSLILLYAILNYYKEPTKTTSPAIPKELVKNESSNHITKLNETPTIELIKKSNKEETKQKNIQKDPEIKQLDKKKYNYRSPNLYKGNSFYDKETGVSFGIRTIYSSNSADGLIVFPNGEEIKFENKSPGSSWHFTSKSKKYILILKNLIFVGSKYTIEVVEI